jgi:predicted dehydrogenase
MAKTSTKRGKGRGKARSTRRGAERIRYAVIGQGYFAQAAILPAFANAQNAELVALFSGDKSKLRGLAKKYRAPFALPYEEYEDFLISGEVDAVYIALPNHLHRDYTLAAARAGVHVLCEKPMAVTSDECKEMIRACDENEVKLMVAYRLHFEEANMTALETVESGKIGDARAFGSLFSMQVAEENIRTNPRDQGGGPLYDIGIYCINAARTLFRSEPVEVSAQLGHRREKRFANIEEQVSATLKFPEDRLATFVAAYGAADHSSYTVLGTEGQIRLSPAYDFSEDLVVETTIGERSRSRTFPKSDQVAPELEYFSSCILGDREPEPSGQEGLNDVRIIEALYRSADSGQPVRLGEQSKGTRASSRQKQRKPGHDMPDLMDARPPSRE